MRRYLLSLLPFGLLLTGCMAPADHSSLEEKAPVGESTVDPAAPVVPKGPVPTAPPLNPGGANPVVPPPVSGQEPAQPNAGAVSEADLAGPFRIEGTYIRGRGVELNTFLEVTEFLSERDLGTGYMYTTLVTGKNFPGGTLVVIGDIDTYNLDGARAGLVLAGGTNILDRESGAQGVGFDSVSYQYTEKSTTLYATYTYIADANAVVGFVSMADESHDKLVKAVLDTVKTN